MKIGNFACSPLSKSSATRTAMRVLPPLLMLSALNSWSMASKKPAATANDTEVHGSAAAPNPKLADYLFSFVQKHELILPFSNGQSSADDPLVYIKSTDAKKRLDFYRAALLVKIKGLHWEIEELSPELELPTVHPVSKFTNRGLFWALDSNNKRVYAFRPVDTTTGCDSSCTPVVFHLLLDTTGKTLKVLEEKKRPLRKAYHQVLTDDDKKKLLELTQKLPEALSTVTLPKSLVNWEEKFPPQTWTFFSSFTIKEAAFTSYRVYEAALTSLKAIKYSSSDRAQMRSQVEEAMGEYFRITDLGQAKIGFDKGLALLADAKTSAEVQGLEYSTLPYLLTWMSSNGVEVSDSAKKLFSMSAYGNSHLADFCSFQKNIIATSDGRSTWTRLMKDWPKHPSCGDKLDKFLKIYVSAVDSTDKVHATDFASFDINALPTFVHDRPDMLLNIVKTLPPKSALRMKALALVDAYFPNAFALPEAKALEPERKQIPTEVKDEVHRDRVLEIERKFLAESMKIPALPLLSRAGKSLGNNALSKLSETKIVLFFASWCPHCQATVAKLVSSKLDEKVWDRIQMVEIFSRDTNDLDQFCATTKLPKARCDAVYRLPPESKSVEAFLDTLGIHAVPRITLIGPGGELLVSDLDMNIRDYADPSVELELTFEAAKMFKKIQ